MEENPSGSLPSNQTARMARVLPLSAVGVTNDQPPDGVPTLEEQARVPRYGLAEITDEGLPPFDPEQPISPRNFPIVTTTRGGKRFPIIGSGGLTAPLPLEDVPLEEDAPEVLCYGCVDPAERCAGYCSPADAPDVIDLAAGGVSTDDWWDDVASFGEESELVELEVGQLEDPFVRWCRRVLYGLAVGAAAAAATAWVLILLPVVAFVWTALWL